MPAWNHWYHITGSTYGAWLPGDPRGFRTRNHREHVEGDYKEPPPDGQYDKRHDAARRRMKREPVVLSTSARRIACDRMVESFHSRSVTVAAMCVGKCHYHILAKFTDDNPRKHVGIAKKNSAWLLAKRGLVAPGGVWAVRSRALPVTDRAHQLNIVNYIKRHDLQGAVVWVVSKQKAQGS